MISLAYGESRRAVITPRTAAGAELRRAPRLELAGLCAKLAVPEGEFLCVIRDVSQTGLSLEAFHRLPDREVLAIELPGGERYRIERVWTAGHRGGFRFAGPVDVSRFVDAPEVAARRAIRINLDRPCRLLCESQRYQGLLCNISQAGALVRSDAPLKPGQTLELSSPALPRTACDVRWRRGAYTGMVFVEGIPLARLGRLVHDLQAPMRTNA